MNRRALIATGFLFFLVLVLGLSPLDLAISDAFYDSTSESWNLSEHAPWSWFYDFGPLPAILLGVLALLTLLFSVESRFCLRFRKASAYFLSNLLLGPGLLVNGVCKGLCGRPRPKQVIDFGGVWDFEPVFLFDLASPGKSLACGHASMGFVFFALFYLLPSRTAKFVSLTFASLLGLGIGAARVVQGGHFASDVVLAAALCWLTASLLSKWMNIDTTYPALEKHPSRAPAWALHSLRALLLLLVAGVLLATPRKKSAGTHPAFENDTLELDLYGILDLETTEENSPKLISLVEGFGTPKSKIDFEGPASAPQHVIRGFFTEMNVSTTLQLSAHSPRKRILQLSPKIEVLRIDQALQIFSPIEIRLGKDTRLIAPEPLPDNLTIIRQHEAPPNE